MIRLRHKLFTYLLRVFDQLLLLSSLGAIIAYYHSEQVISPFRAVLRGYYSADDALAIAILGLGWTVIFNSFVHYETNRLKTLGEQVIDVTKATSVAMFYLMLVAGLFSFSVIDFEVIASLWIAACSAGILGRMLIRWLLMRVRRSGYNFRHLIIMGNNPHGHEIARRIDATPVLGFKIIGFISEQSGPSPETSLPLHPAPVLGALQDTQNLLATNTVDEILICLPVQTHYRQIYDVVQLAHDIGIVVRFFPSRADTSMLARMRVESFEGDSVVTFFREQHLMQLLGKFTIDLLGSFVLLLLLSPLMVLVAAAIKLTSPGPVLFWQERVGMNKRRFRLYKFRSMYIDAEKRRRELMHLNEMDGPVFKIKNDPRITPVGRFIRQWSIDELPQLLNVLRGQMSLVGPRPPLPEEVEHYEWLFRKRLSIRPGITCLWQISGRNQITFKEWMEMDRYYIENWTLWLDMVILIKTIPAVLLRKGAS